ncbi:unnamed protein product, partial [Larinioides sclopetarius]
SLNILKIHSSDKAKQRKFPQRKGSGKPSFQHQGSKETKLCKHCNKTHRGECNFKNATCYQCGVKGHIKPACKASNTNFVETGTSCSNQSDFYLNNINVLNMSDSSKPFTTDVDINGVKVSMQIDTGSAFSIISVEKFQQLNLKSVVSLAVPTLKSYTGNDLQIIGNYEVPVTYLNKCYSLPLIVVDCINRPTLLGREWMKALNIKIDDFVN